jgi:hypothetical protein
MVTATLETLQMATGDEVKQMWYAFRFDTKSGLPRFVRVDVDAAPLVAHKWSDKDAEVNVDGMAQLMQEWRFDEAQEKIGKNRGGKAITIKIATLESYGPVEDKRRADLAKAREPEVLMVPQIMRVYQILYSKEDAQRALDELVVKLYSTLQIPDLHGGDSTISGPSLFHILDAYDNVRAVVRFSCSVIEDSRSERIPTLIDEKTVYDKDNVLRKSPWCSMSDILHSLVANGLTIPPTDIGHSIRKKPDIHFAGLYVQINNENEQSQSGHDHVDPTHSIMDGITKEWAIWHPKSTQWSCTLFHSDVTAISAS